MLVSHTEFENSLVPDGANTLYSLLFGDSAPGGYAILLSSNGFGISGPCQTLADGDSACVLLGSLLNPEPAAFGDATSGCGGPGFTSPTGSTTNPITANGPCFPLTMGIGGGGLTFNGTAVASTTATYPASITDVFLDALACETISASGPGQDTTSPNSCAQGTVSAYSKSLTHAPLPAAGGATPCGGTGQVSCAVTVPQAGDSINVQVTISFQ